MSTIDTSLIKITGQKINPEVQKNQKLVKASKELESIFLSHMLKAMEQTIPRDKSSSSGNLAKMMFSSVMGKAISKQGGIGLAEFIYKSLLETGENPLDKLKSEKDIDALYHINSLRGSDE
jgi:Rod binding domain-containing protein